MCTPSLRLLPLQDLLLQCLQQQGGHRGKDLIFLPDQVHGRFELWCQGPKDQPAAWGGVDQVLKGQKESKPLLDKKRAIVGQAEGALQPQLVDPAAAPPWDVVLPPLLGAEQGEPDQIVHAQGALS